MSDGRDAAAAGTGTAAAAGAGPAAAPTQVGADVDARVTLADGGRGAATEGPARFSSTGPLPRGTTVLEASAGTGKTYTIAALAARYVAEGCPLSQLMLVTFGRNATDELRLRVRERLVGVEQALSGALGGQTPEQLDEIEALLLDSGPDELARRHTRIALALAEFDSATITTTHEFCLRMLDGLGVLGDHEHDPVFVDQVSELTRQVAGDVYLRRYAHLGDPGFDHADAVRLAEAVISAPHTEIVPDPVLDPDSVAAERVRFACAVRHEVDARKRADRLFTYDDMLTRLQATLVDPITGPLAIQRLRERFAVVMIDEFQDTDPVQWDIVRRAFVGGPTTVVLIGDPKQAIYAFRGADVYSYLDAVRAADTVQTLDINWRTDQQVLDALDGLLTGAALGDPRIVVRPVRADHHVRRLVAGDHPAARPSGPRPVRNADSADAPEGTDALNAPDSAGSGSPLDPVRLRYRRPPGGNLHPLAAENRALVRRDLVADVTRLLASGAVLRLGRDGGPAGDRPVGPADIAVLVRRNRDGEAIRSELVAAKVPAVMLGAASVFAGEAADEWLLMLRALADPRQGTIRRAALTHLVGWTFRELATADDDKISDLTTRFHRWSRLLAQRGMAAVVEAVSVDTDMTGRLLRESGGERRLTDLRHVGQAAHGAAVRHQLGPQALVEWLEQRVSDARRDSDAEGTRRLEVDAEAVTIVTVHRSKGLQFPIVYLPDAWDNYVGDKDDGAILRLHDPRTGRAQLDIGGRGAPGRVDRLRASRQDEAEEQLRLFYVAVTRAQCQVVLWWAPGRTTECSALQRLLHRPLPSLPSEPSAEQAASHSSAPATHRPTALTPIGVYAQAVQHAPLAASHVPERHPDGNPATAPRRAGLALEPLPDQPRSPYDWQADDRPTVELVARRFDRELDLTWRRTSYSALTALAHGAAGTAEVTRGLSEPEIVKEDDESDSADDDIRARSVQGLSAVDPPGPPIEASTSEQSAGDDPEPRIEELDPAWARPSPMADLPGGVRFGTAVHAVLESVNFSASNLPDELTRVCAEVLSRGEPSGFTPEALAAALLPSLITPLGPLADDRRLCDLPGSDRLPELSFEFPLGGGDDPVVDTVTLTDIADLFARHVPPEDPLARYPDLLSAPDLGPQILRGYLTGSIDAVLRFRPPSSSPTPPGWLGGDVDQPSSATPDATPGSRDVRAHPTGPAEAGDEPRYVVVDYKTNRLGTTSPGLADLGASALILNDYRPDRLAEAMMTSHYPLQALLYQVALHRLLRWRQPGYDPAVHLGGVLYLFLRGMAGPDTPRVDGVAAGVFSWASPASLVVALSDLLDGGRGRTDAGRTDRLARLSSTNGSATSPDGDRR